MKYRNPKLLGSAAVAAFVIALATPASAQTGPDAAVQNGEESAEPETITVTGSRIQQPGVTSNSPITTVGAEEIRLQGATNIEGVLNRLPQVQADANENVSNGSDGTARLNLRNLGSGLIDRARR